MLPSAVTEELSVPDAGFNRTGFESSIKAQETVRRGQRCQNLPNRVIDLCTVCSGPSKVYIYFLTSEYRRFT